MEGVGGEWRGWGVNGGVGMEVEGGYSCINIE